MAAVHECERCNAMCDCDGEDTFHTQDDDCVHLTDADECGIDESDAETIGRFGYDSSDELEIADSIRRGGTL